MHPLLLLIFASLTMAFPMPPKLNIFQTPPVDDPFYDAPDDLSQYNNGDIFRSRQVDPSLALKASLSTVNQVAYKTKDAHGNDSHTIATIFKPLFPSKEPKIFSYQTWEDSAELNCSPSYTLVKGLLSPNWVTGAFDTTIAIEFALDQGWYVVVSDHEGPNSAFIEGYTQGQNGLDGIQAIINFFKLPQDTPTTLYGYSGGASATVWMANLHESYAPNINIVGAAHGGTPVDVKTTVEHLDREDRMFSGFIVGAFAGLLNAYPEIEEEVWPHLDQDFKNDLTLMRTPDNCVITEVLLYHNQQFHTQMNVDFWAFKPIADLLRRESLLKNVSTGILSTPKFPRYIFHAKGDEVLPVEPVQQFVNEQCADGANIQYVPWDSNDHVSIEYLGIPDAFQFIIQAFEGKTPQVKCGTPSNDILTLGSKLAGATIGQVVVDLLNAVNGVLTPLGQIKFDPNETP